MSCHKSGLILQRHNGIAGEWHALFTEAKNSGAVYDEPVISHTISQPQSLDSVRSSEEKFVSTVFGTGAPLPSLMYV